MSELVDHAVYFCQISQCSLERADLNLLHPIYHRNLGFLLTNFAQFCLWKESMLRRTSLNGATFSAEPFYAAIILTHLKKLCIRRKCSEDHSLRRVEDGRFRVRANSSPFLPTNCVRNSSLRPISARARSCWVLLTEFKCQLDPLFPVWKRPAELSLPLVGFFITSRMLKLFSLFLSSFHLFRFFSLSFMTLLFWSSRWELSPLGSSFGGGDGRDCCCYGWGTSVRMCGLLVI